MADANSQLQDKLTGYLGSLAGPSLVMLCHEIDRAGIAADLDPANAMILRAARQALEAKGAWGATASRPQAIAFADTIPFQIRPHTEVKHRGRICIDSLRSIWVALVRDPGNDTLPASIREAAQAVAGAPDNMRRVVAGLRATLMPVLGELYRDVATDLGHSQRVSAQLGGLRVAQDLADVIAVLSLAPRLDEFRAFIDKGGNRVDHADEKSWQPLASALDHFTPEQIIYPMVMLLGHMAAPGSLPNLLVFAEQSDEPAKLKRSRFSPVVEVLLNELDILACTVRDGLAAWHVVDDVVPAVRRFHEISSGLALAINMELPSDWSKRLAAKRSRISDCLRETVEMTLGRLRLGIQPNGVGVVAPDPLDTEQAIESARLLMAIKPLRSELALNECVTRVHAAVESFFDTAARNLPVQARAAEAVDMPALNARFDALYRTSMVLFGDEYSGLLRRSGEVSGLRLRDGDEMAAA